MNILAETLKHSVLKISCILEVESCISRVKIFMARRCFRAAFQSFSLEIMGGRGLSFAEFAIPGPTELAQGRMADLAAKGIATAEAFEIVPPLAQSH